MPTLQNVSRIEGCGNYYWHRLSKPAPGAQGAAVTAECGATGTRCDSAAHMATCDPCRKGGVNCPDCAALATQ